MSTTAQAILDKVKMLPLEEQAEVCAGLVELQERQRQGEIQKQKLRDMQSGHSGKGLLKRMLDERGRERGRGPDTI